LCRACLGLKHIEKCPSCENPVNVDDAFPSHSLDAATTLCERLSSLLSNDINKDLPQSVSKEISSEIHDTRIPLHSNVTPAAEDQTTTTYSVDISAINHVNASAKSLNLGHKMSVKRNNVETSRDETVVDTPDVLKPESAANDQLSLLAGLNKDNISTTDSKIIPRESLTSAQEEDLEGGTSRIINKLKQQSSRTKAKLQVLKQCSNPPAKRSNGSLTSVPSPLLVNKGSAKAAVSRSSNYYTKRNAKGETKLHTAVIKVLDHWFLSP